MADHKCNILRALAQRREANLKHIQPVIQVRAELAFGDNLIEVAVVAAISRASDRRVRLEPERS